MLLSGFTNAHFTKSLVCGLVITSIAASVLDVKYLFYIQVQPHLWRYHQFWRLLVYQVSSKKEGEGGAEGNHVCFGKLG